MRTQLIVCIGLGMLAGAPASTAAGSAITGLRLVDRYVMPYSDGLAGTIFDNTLVGGLSGIDFDAATGTYYALSDNNFNASSQVTHFVLLATVGQGDLDGDGLVNGADLGLLLSQWGGPGTADLDGNGIVDGADLGLVLAAWSA